METYFVFVYVYKMANVQKSKGLFVEIVIQEFKLHVY